MEDVQGSASWELRAFRTRYKKWTDTPAPEHEGEELARLRYLGSRQQHRYLVAVEDTGSGHPLGTIPQESVAGCETCTTSVKLHETAKHNM